MKKQLPFLLLFAVLPLLAQERTLRLADLAAEPELTAHVNGAPAPLPPGTTLQSGSEGLRLEYVFASAGHDACMIEFPVEQVAFAALTVELTLTAAGPRPFVVLTDQGGEKHYFSLVNTRSIEGQALKKAGRHVLSIPVQVKNQHPGEKFAFRWGGDQNQRIDFPVRSVLLGLNDFPDETQGNGWCVFHSVTFR